MRNHEISYERDVNKSYMKIPAAEAISLDEKLMFRKCYQGILPMEKCYVNGSGQYWYNISGRQALDAYCRVHGMNHGFFETLMLRICSQLEILEWNLIDSRCLVMDPELIFVNHSGEEISFILYPDTQGNFLEELRHLMEYLLTKLNHGDKEGVHQAYGIYSLMLTDGYSIAEVKQAILSNREKDAEKMEAGSFGEMASALDEDCECVSADASEAEKQDVLQEIEQKLLGLFERVKKMLWSKKDNKEQIPMVVYPEEEPEETEGSIHPTICLAASLEEPRGVLIYEGRQDYPDFELAKGSCILGKNPRVKLYINRETISQFHAKFDYWNQKYYIEDMNSTNGTFVNDEMLNYKEQRELSPGDVLRFADVKYRFL
ncbi:MAG: FHA domain-containing protein [Agathobacter sp.]|nr:FHA domain-containing protein [Agathobacter sp.]